MASDRKKKEKKKDFVKQKLKVGKTKPLSTTHTDTSFRAKAITLPTQSIIETGKSITDYLKLLDHTNSKTRKETLYYIRDNFVRSSQSDNTASRSVDYKTIISKSSRLLTDVSASVRKAVVELFSEIPPSALDANAPLIMIHVQTAMSHIDVDIRASSTAIIDILVKKAPQQVCRASFSRTMQCFISLFGWQELLKAMEAERAKNGSAKKNQQSIAGANSIIAASSLEQAGKMTKARTDHIKSLQLLIRAGVSPDYGLDDDNEVGVIDIHGDNESETDQVESSRNTSNDETVEYDPLSEEEANRRVQEVIASSLTPRGIALAVKQRKANDVAYKFLVPSTSLPYLSLNLFGPDSKTSAWGMSSKFLSSNTDSKSKKSGKFKTKVNDSTSLNVDSTFGLGLRKKYDPRSVSVTEDVESRTQLVDYYKPVIEEGLGVLIKEGGSLGRAAKEALNTVEKVNYEGI